MSAVPEVPEVPAMPALPDSSRAEDPERSVPGAPPRTEAANPATRGLDLRSTREVLGVIHEEDACARDAVGAALDDLAALVDDVVGALRAGGRLLYIGAGTSGRLGVLDASECPPTFGVSPDLIQGIIAGGDAALRTAVEGAEDSEDAGRAAMIERGVGSRDVVCGIAASGTTPYVRAALREAAARGAVTALIHSNVDLEPCGSSTPRHEILLDVGPEVIAGSTRLKCGTATKMALNLLSTTAMVRLGKVYDNRMVDLVATNSKLRHRARRLVAELGSTAELGSIDDARAEELLRAAEYDVKTAIVMARARIDAAAARHALAAQDGSLRATLTSLGVDVAVSSDGTEPTGRCAGARSPRQDPRAR